MAPNLLIAKEIAKRGKDIYDTRLRENMERDHFGEFLVMQVHLVQSQLQRGGALHTILRSVTLQS